MVVRALANSPQVYPAQLSRLTIGGPCVHQFAPLIERIASSIGLLRLVANNMSQRSLSYFAMVVGHIASPIAKARTETMDGCPFNSHSAQNHFHRHVG